MLDCRERVWGLCHVGRLYRVMIMPVIPIEKNREWGLAVEFRDIQSNLSRGYKEEVNANNVAAHNGGK